LLVAKRTPEVVVVWFVKWLAASDEPSTEAIHGRAEKDATVRAVPARFNSRGDVGVKIHFKRKPNQAIGRKSR
jgi:hypothetical protein